ncbi:hypothetical protein ACG83_33865 [Frankia sp. R43]|uniref:hypothetical protein n=1 Tax=Frankia sp. R43 TaxID=269536 RepID=UPI0006C9EB19|nr:hypothetical protein [Frankia sp. R43]KPM51792.1 hypothetical protein ACG83_33865 [Frankia sp. R43]
MTAISSYARALAVATGNAAPTATVRHAHLSARPFVLVPLTLAGEANAPLAAMVGTARDEATLLVVAQPRNRDLRFAFADQLAQIMLPHVLGFAAATEELTNGPRSLDAPQLVVPNPAGVEFVRLFARSTRFRSTEGEYAVAPSVPLLGRWLTFFAERAEIPGSSLMLAVTDLLGLHWATGQSALEDANLAALLGWIDPPPGLPGAAAARLAEDPRHCPPAGPTTDPGFDTEQLAPAIAAYDTAVAATVADTAAPAAGPAAGPAGVARAVTRLENLLRTQLQPTWDLVWRALDLLGGLPAGASVPARWETDRARYTGFHTYMVEEGLPQARRDGAVAAARRLNRIEQAQAGYDADRAFDDPLVMAQHRVTGEAFSGTVVAVERDRRIPNGRGKGRLVTRPLLTVRTEDPVRLTVGAKVVASSRRRQECVIEAIDVPPAGGGLLITLEARSGMGRSAAPAPGTVAEVGESLCYSAVLADGVRSAPMPDTADTPWTHGGPPEPYEPTEKDTAEAWE